MCHVSIIHTLKPNSALKPETAFIKGYKYYNQNSPSHFLSLVTYQFVLSLYCRSVDDNITYTFLYTLNQP